MGLIASVSHGLVTAAEMGWLLFQALIAGFAISGATDLPLTSTQR
jgi:hypothetical protein